MSVGVVVQLPYEEHEHEIADPTVDVQEAAVVGIEVARLRRAMRSLPVLERRVLAWRYGIAGSERLSLNEISQRLRLPLSTVWDIEQRALKLLRKDYGLQVAA